VSLAGSPQHSRNAVSAMWCQLDLAEDDTEPIDREARVTDRAARVVPVGEDAATRTVSRRWTLDFLATLASEL
jgi:hypothetical protein